MNWLRIMLLALSSSSACLPTLASANAYVFVLLEHKPIAINSKGQMVAPSFGQDFERGVVFRGGKWHNMPPHSRPAGLNARADVAGQYVSGAHYMEAAVWPRKGEALRSNRDVSVVNGINASRMVVGWTFTSIYKCYTWTPSKGYLELPMANGADQCSANGVNSAGAVTGGINSNLQWTSQDAFIWKGGRLKLLPRLSRPTRNDQIGRAINDHDHVVGAAVEEGTPHYHPFYWDGERIADLYAGLCRDCDAFPRAINNADEIVGYVSMDEGLTKHAVRFADGQMIHLDDEVAELDGWRLEDAFGINDDGIIVGSAYKPGEFGGFMLIPQALYDSGRMTDEVKAAVRAAQGAKDQASSVIALTPR